MPNTPTPRHIELTQRAIDTIQPSLLRALEITDETGAVVDAMATLFIRMAHALGGYEAARAMLSALYEDVNRMEAAQNSAKPAADDIGAPAGRA